MPNRPTLLEVQRGIIDLDEQNIETREKPSQVSMLLGVEDE